MQTFTGTWDEVPEEVDIDVTDQFVFDVTVRTIDEIVEKFIKLPVFIKWLIGKDLNRTVMRLQVMMAIFKNLNIKL